MNKKTHYHAYYYSIVDEITPAQLKITPEVASVDVSVVQQRMEEKAISGLVQEDTDYHRRLQTVAPAPYVLYYQWILALLDRPTLAIVWPRQMSSYAEQVLEELFQQLQYYDVVTVSGMAPGVDTLCHELSLQYNIPTIAVLGWGFHYFLRGVKRDLMERIVHSGGAIISEYKHSFKPTERSFPQRNRIIAWLADVVFLPEAKEKSWSLITADFGSKMHKPVAAPMQSIFAETSRGTNNYIAEWRIVPIAHITAFLEKHYTRKQNEDQKSEIIIPRYDLTDEERTIIAMMKEQAESSMNMLSEKCDYSSQEILIHMSMLEMKWVVMQKYPGVYVLKK